MEPITRDGALALLREALGAAADFRPGQWEALDAVLNHGEKRLVVERTGWGKSAVYFLATRLLRKRGRGPTLVVSPLLALMRNQVAAAARFGLVAARLDSSVKGAARDAVEQQLRGNGLDLLLVTPERLADPRFREGVLSAVAGDVGLVVVDEAHCISDWGHDFRPDYKRLRGFLQALPDTSRLLAVTATANDRVVEDIRRQLGDIGVQRGPLVRESLELFAYRIDDYAERLAYLAHSIPRAAQGLEGSGIVYTLTIRDCQVVAQWLESCGIRAEAYWGGLDGDLREEREAALLANDMVLVTTSALGMGFDKPDLGFVVHFQAPGNVIAYYQQVGRAGRAIGTAYGVLLMGESDERILEHFRDSAFPTPREVKRILETLDTHGPMSVAALEGELNFGRGRLETTLKFLRAEQPAPVAKDADGWDRTPIPYTYPSAKVAEITAIRRREWAQMQAYPDHGGCLMRFLSDALDDPGNAKDCGRCARCRGLPANPPAVPQGLLKAAQRFLRHSEMPIPPKKKLPGAALASHGITSLKSLEHQEGRVLARYHSRPWGDRVALGKQRGRFDDRLVAAVARMVTERWMPPLAWVCAVPSQNQPTLVPGFARALAGRLGLPFVHALHKAQPNAPQKDQHNTTHRIRNLDGTFGVAPTAHLPPGGCLLVDDVVDSGWTFAVCAALLRQAGAEAVFPIALASAKS